MPPPRSFAVMSLLVPLFGLLLCVLILTVLLAHLDTTVTTGRPPVTFDDFKGGMAVVLSFVGSLLLSRMVG